MTLSHGAFDFGQIGDIPSLLNIETLDIPVLKIPNWPNGLTTKVKLGVRSFQIPTNDHSTGLLKLHAGEEKLEFNIYGDGAFSFSYYDKNCHPDFNLHMWTSSNYEMLPRLQALFLFYQFQKEIHDTIIVNLQTGKFGHELVVTAAKKALAPFSQVQ